MKHAIVRVVDLITTDEDQKFEPAGRLASTIIELLQKEQNCRPSDLKAMGFAPDEVDANWHMAQSLAFVELKLMRPLAVGEVE